MLNLALEKTDICSTLAQLSKWQLSNEKAQSTADFLAMQQYLRDVSMRGNLLQRNLAVMSTNSKHHAGNNLLTLHDLFP